MTLLWSLCLPLGEATSSEVSVARRTAKGLLREPRWHIIRSIRRQCLWIEWLRNRTFTAWLGHLHDAEKRTERQNLLDISWRRPGK